MDPSRAFLGGLAALLFLLPIVPAAAAGQTCVGPVCTYTESWRSGGDCEDHGYAEGRDYAGGGIVFGGAYVDATERCSTNDFYTFRESEVHAGAWSTFVGGVEAEWRDYSYVNHPGGATSQDTLWIRADAVGHSLDLGFGRGSDTTCCPPPRCYWTVVVDGQPTLGDWVCMPVPDQPANVWGTLFRPLP